MHRRIGGTRHLVEQIRVAQQEHPFPGHQHVVEKDGGVHFFEARAQGVVEVGTAHIETLAAQEFEPRGIAGDGKIENVGFRPLSVSSSETGRIHGNFVRDGPQGRQNARALHNQPGAGFPHHAQPHALGQVGLAGNTAALQVDQRVGQGQVVVADVLVIVADMCLEGRTVLGEKICRRTPGGEIDIQKIRRTPQHAAPGARPTHHHPAALLQFSLRLRNDEGVSHPVARCGRHVSHFVAQVGAALQIVERRHRLYTAAQRRVRGNVANPLAAQPDFARPFPQSGDVVLPRASCHDA